MVNLRYIVQLYDYLNMEQKEELSKYGVIFYETKAMPVVLVKTSKPEEINKLGFVKDINPDRKGKWYNEKGQSAPPFMKETHELLSDLSGYSRPIQNEKVI